MSHTTQETQKSELFCHWRSMVLVLGLTFALMIIFIMETSAEIGAPSTNGSTSEKWTIEEGDYVVRSNEEISIGGEIIIEIGGTLIFSNISLTYLEREDEFNYGMFWISIDGIFTIENDSRIQAPWGGIIINGVFSTVSIFDVDPLMY